ncbi:MAG: hypothetical protein ACLSDJ_02535 [Butyricimonas faecihominis]
MGVMLYLKCAKLTDESLMGEFEATVTVDSDGGILHGSRQILHEAF